MATDLGNRPRPTPPSPLVRLPRGLWRFVRARPLGALGGAILLALILIALFADLVATHDPIAQDIPNRLRAPGRDFLFGTDTFGRDIFSRVVHGARTSLYVGLVTVAVATIVGTALGILSAYVGGIFDLTVQRLVDALMAFPALVLALVMVAAFGASLNNVIIAVTVVLTPQMTRLARAQALTVKEEEYITAAVSVGTGPLRTMLRHILPNSLTPVMVLSTGYLGEAIVTEAALSFLGLGVPPPDPSWGRMLQEGAFLYLETAPWLTIFPGLALSLVVFSFSLFGDALRDTLDPRLRGR